MGVWVCICLLWLCCYLVGVCSTETTLNNHHRKKNLFWLFHTTVETKIVLWAYIDWDESCRNILEISSIIWTTNVGNSIQFLNTRGAFSIQSMEKNHVFQLCILINPFGWAKLKILNQWQWAYPKILTARHPTRKSLNCISAIYYILTLEVPRLDLTCSCSVHFNRSFQLLCSPH